eukprot:162369-Pelagomonas_calceolata.AAC.9
MVRSPAGEGFRKMVWHPLLVSSPTAVARIVVPDVQWAGNVLHTIDAVSLRNAPALHHSTCANTRNERNKGATTCAPDGV